MSDISTSKAVEFTSLGIGTVLKSFRLQVPLYQREYAWEDDQVRQLYEDFSNAKYENRDYFLGTIVTISNGDTKPLEIVDGQQRLTTTALLLAAFRNYLSSLGSASLIVESINHEFLTIIDRTASQRVPKLILNIDDNDFFSKLISDDQGAQPQVPTRNSHELLMGASKTAKMWVENFVRTFSESDRVARINDWLSFVEHNATVILLKTPSGAQAFKMFETLNDRGLKTSQADLVKSYLFGQSGDRIVEAQARWSSMRDNLEEIDDDDRAINFLRHTLISTKKFVRSEDVYDTTNKEIRGVANSVEFLADLERLSRVYVATFRPDSDHWASHPPATLKALQVFNKFDIKPMRPLVLALALKFPPAASHGAFVLMVSVAVRLIIASATRSGTNEQTFATAALAVFKSEITTVSDLKNAILRVVVNDADFQETFSTAKSSKPDLARYYLRALEAAAANEGEPWYILNDDETSITLEHILPKNPKQGKWPKFDSDDARRYLKRLGNLCLLQGRTNSSIDNEFSTKSDLYKNSPYVFTSQISNYSEWSPETIENRQKSMAQMALKAWPI